MDKPTVTEPTAQDGAAEQSPETDAFLRGCGQVWTVSVEEVRAKMASLERRLRAAEGDCEAICNSYAAENQRLHDRAESAEAALEAGRKALRDVLGLIDSGYLVRDTSKDGLPGWALTQVGPMRVLARAQDIAARSGGPAGREGDVPLQSTKVHGQAAGAVELPASRRETGIHTSEKGVLEQRTVTTTGGEPTPRALVAGHETITEPITELIERLSALEAKATKGPWEHDCDRHYDRGERQHFIEHHISGVDRDRVCTANHFDAQEITPNDHGVFSDEQARHDFRFIAALRNAWPLLVAHIAALERRSIPIADIEAEIDHIEQNGKAVARWSGSENEGRCRELCAMYLREFIVSHRMKLKLEEVRALTPAKDGGEDGISSGEKGAT